MRKFLFPVISIAIGCGASLILGESLLTYYYSALKSDVMDAGLVRYHSRMGWVLSPGWSGTHTHHDYTTQYHTDLTGKRAQSPSPEGSTVSTAIIGDSYTFGLGVADDETFVSLLNRNAETKAGYSNYGIPGYSTDQELLLLEDRVMLSKPDSVMLIVYLANDLLDIMLDYPLQAEQAKPLFTLNNNELALVNVPVPQTAKSAQAKTQTLSSLVMTGIGEPPPATSSSMILQLLKSIINKKMYDPIDVEAKLNAQFEPNLALFMALVERMHTIVSSQSASFQVVLLPGQEMIKDENSLSYLYQNFFRKQLMLSLEQSQIETLDLYPTLLAESEKGSLYFPNEGHLNKAGHALVADVIASFSEQ